MPTSQPETREKTLVAKTWPEQSWDWNIQGLIPEIMHGVFWGLGGGGHANQKHMFFAHGHTLWGERGLTSGNFVSRLQKGQLDSQT